MSVTLRFLSSQKVLQAVSIAHFIIHSEDWGCQYEDFPFQWCFLVQQWITNFKEMLLEYIVA